MHARDGEQHARGGGALLGEREVLAQARSGREPRRLYPAARIVAVDEVDHLEDVRAVLLALHHQPVRERELDVAQDVRPDLRELGLNWCGLHDRRAEHREELTDDFARALADAANDARQRHDLLEEPSRRDALRRVRNEHFRADRQVAVLAQVAGDEVRRSGRDGGTQRQRVAGAQQRQEVVERAADVAHVDLDVRERRGPERDDDVPRRGGVRHAVRPCDRSGCRDALEDIGRARLLERHASGPDRRKALRIDLDADGA